LPALPLRGSRLAMSDLAQYIRELTILLVPLLFTITCHEAAHGLAANLLGDPTAKMAGRVTLNPLRHLDPLGLLIMFIPPHIGWARPVPVDPRYFRNQRTGMFLVALAGPGANVLVACLCAAIFHGIIHLPVEDPSSWMVTVLVPLATMAHAGVYVSLLIAAFNMLPIPPLDGSSILARFLPERLAETFLSLSRYGILLVIGLLFLGNLVGFSILGTLLFPLVERGAWLLGVSPSF